MRIDFAVSHAEGIDGYGYTPEAAPKVRGVPVTDRLLEDQGVRVRRGLGIVGDPDRIEEAAGGLQKSEQEQDLEPQHESPAPNLAGRAGPKPRRPGAEVLDGHFSPLTETLLRFAERGSRSIITDQSSHP